MWDSFKFTKEWDERESNNHSYTYIFPNSLLIWSQKTVVFCMQPIKETRKLADGSALALLLFVEGIREFVRCKFFWPETTSQWRQSVFRWRVLSHSPRATLTFVAGPWQQFASSATCPSWATKWGWYGKAATAGMTSSESRWRSPPCVSGWGQDAATLPPKSPASARPRRHRRLHLLAQV